jgi:hypothetical protein
MGRNKLQAALRTHVAFVRYQFIPLFNDIELTQMADFWKRVEERMASSATRYPPHSS